MEATNRGSREEWEQPPSSVMCRQQVAVKVRQHPPVGYHRLLLFLRPSPSVPSVAVAVKALDNRKARGISFSSFSCSSFRVMAIFFDRNVRGRHAPIRRCIPWDYGRRLSVNNNVRGQQGLVAPDMVGRGNIVWPGPCNARPTSSILKFAILATFLDMHFPAVSLLFI